MQAIVRAAALMLTVATTGFLLQVGSPAQASGSLPVAAIQPAAIPVLGGTPPGSDHEYFLSRHQVVALGRRNITLPILMYHYIRTPPSARSDWMGYKLSIAPSDFAAQMDWLSGNGYHPVDFNDVRAYFAGRQPLPTRPIVITFDDGYADLYTAAFPVLSAHDFKAVAYIVSGFLGRQGYATAEQVVQMDHNGIEIASHTVNHADLARSSPGLVWRELVDSKAWLEHLLGHQVLDFAYPSGKFNAPVVAAVQQAGYDTAVTTLDSVDHSVADRRLWTRIRVGGGESLADFARSLGTPMPATTITAVDIEAGWTPLPSLVRPAHLLFK
jgi:peptidoglycan/xylan/chitin deacetylase (PgdA/CDA1 family)